MFTNEEKELIQKALIEKLMSLEYCYKKNINTRPDYAELIATTMRRYNSIYKKLSNTDYITENKNLQQKLKE